MTDPKTEARLPRDLVMILRTEARNQRTPPIDYAIAEDGGRMVHRPDPDIAMAELLEEAATALAAKDAELAKFDFEKHSLKVSLARAEANLAEARKALEWHPIETAPLNTIVDLWCTYADAPASWGNDRPAGEICHNRHKSKEHGWFGNESNDGIPQANGPDLVPVAWRWPAPEIPLEMMERFVAARALLNRRAEG